MLVKKSFILIEILVAIMIIATLAGFGLPGYSVFKERMLDKEAKANLALIQTAENIRIMEAGSYYGSTNIANINENLKLGLPIDAVSWNYEADAVNERATATRILNGGRVWTLAFATDSTVVCTGTGCP